MIKKVISILLFIPIFVGLALGIIILFAFLLDYKPEAEIEISTTQSPDTLDVNKTYYALTWNVGYAGLSADMDFFYDDGSQVRTSLEQTTNNFEFISNYLLRHDSIPFMFLQEVDHHSARSYRINQQDVLAGLFSDRWNGYAQNYDVFFVPTPVFKPYGKVEAGIMSLSPYKPKNAVRHAFPENYSGVKGLFMLDRCFMTMRYPLSNGKQMVVINTHNSAYDDGSLREAQMEKLTGFMLAEYSKGNFVLAGGDWNQCPPGFEPEYTTEVFDTVAMSFVPDTLLANWNWAFDNRTPTNRRLYMPYEAGNTFTTTIDYFVTSPNISVKEVFTDSLAFKHSDHNPVFLGFHLVTDTLFTNNSNE